MDPVNQDSEVDAVCADCGTHKGIEIGPCPFDSDINGVYVDVALCVDCHGLRADEI